jgi:hypothetical protein
MPHSKLISSKEIVIHIKRHRIQPQLGLHPTLVNSPHDNIVVPLQRGEMGDIDLLRRACSPEVDCSLDSTAFDHLDRPVAPEPRDVHLVETLD